MVLGIGLSPDRFCGGILKMDAAMTTISTLAARSLLAFQAHSRQD